MTTTEPANIDVKEKQDGDQLESRPEDKVEQTAESSVPRTLSVGPIDGVEYPIKAIYCGSCTLPIEYCQYYPTYDKCKEWLENNLPDEFNKLNLGKR